MDQMELSTLNSLVTFAAENIPGGLSEREQEIARKVGLWNLDGLPVAQVCPYCREAMPADEVRRSWMDHHVDNPFHRWRWLARNTVHRITRGR